LSSATYSVNTLCEGNSLFPQQSDPYISGNRFSFGTLSSFEKQDCSIFSYTVGSWSIIGTTKTRTVYTIDAALVADLSSYKKVNILRRVDMQ